MLKSLEFRQVIWTYQYNYGMINSYIRKIILVINELITNERDSQNVENKTYIATSGEGTVRELG